MDSSTELHTSEMWFKEVRCRGFPTISFIFPRKFNHQDTQKFEKPITPECRISDARKERAMTRETEELTAPTWGTLAFIENCTGLFQLPRGLHACHILEILLARYVWWLYIAVTVSKFFGQCGFDTRKSYTNIKIQKKLI